MLSWIERRAFEDSVVLADQAWIQRVIPGLLQGIHPVDFGGRAGEGDRREGSELFAEAQISVEELEDLMDRYSIDFIVAVEVEPQSDVLRASDRAIFAQQFPATIQWQQSDTPSASPVRVGAPGSGSYCCHGRWYSSRGSLPGKRRWSGSLCGSGICARRISVTGSHTLSARLSPPFPDVS